MGVIQIYLSEYFSYDGIDCRDFNLKVINTDKKNMGSINFGSNRSLEEFVSDDGESSLFGVKHKPLEFNIILAKIDDNYKMLSWTLDDRINIAKWLFQDTFKPLVFEETPDIIYYCMPVGLGSRAITADNRGYITIKMRCNAPSPFSRPIITEYNLINDVTTTIRVDNYSNLSANCFPEVQFELLGTKTDFSIKNISDKNREFAFTGLDVSEIVYVDNKRKSIETNAVGVYRFSNFNKNWLRLVPGQNTLEVSGSCNLILRFQYPISI